MQTISKERLEMLRKDYPAGTKVCLDGMEGESRMVSGLTGEVRYVDDIGQIHVGWDNGSGLALIPGVDQFHKIRDPEKKKSKSKAKGETSR